MLLLTFFLFSAHKAGLVDYSRFALLRTASDFDRAPNTSVDAYTAFEASQGGFEPAIENILITAGPVVDDIVKNWESIYSAGIAPQASLNGRYVVCVSLSFSARPPLTYLLLPQLLR